MKTIAAIPTAMTLALALPISAQDLKATKISCNVNTAQPGQKFTVSSTIKNVGVFRSTGKSVVSAYYLSETPILFPALAVRLGTFTTPILKPGNSANHSTTFTMPSNLKSKTYYVFVFADSNNKILELNELNNTKSSSIVGTSTDLTLGIDVTTPLTAGTQALVKVTVTNLGTLRSKATKVLIFLSLDPIITTSDVFLRSFPVPQVDGNKSVTIQPVVQIPFCDSSYAVLGLTSFGVILNPASANRAPEINYNNNKKMLIRKVTTSSTGAKVLEWWPKYRADKLGPTSLFRARFRLPERAAIGRMCITAPNFKAAQYLLVMSGDANTFRWDTFSDIGFNSLNSNYFPRWFGNLGLNGSRNDIGLSIPKLPAHGFKVYIYHYYVTVMGNGFGANRLLADFIQ